MTSQTKNARKVGGSSRDVSDELMFEYPAYAPDGPDLQESDDDDECGDDDEEDEESDSENLPSRSCFRAPAPVSTTLRSNTATSTESSRPVRSAAASMPMSVSTTPVSARKSVSSLDSPLNQAVTLMAPMQSLSVAAQPRQMNGPMNPLAAQAYARAHSQVPYGGYFRTTASNHGGNLMPMLPSMMPQYQQHPRVGAPFGVQSQFNPSVQAHFQSQQQRQQAVVLAHETPSPPSAPSAANLSSSNRVATPRVGSMNAASQRDSSNVTNPAQHQLSAAPRFG